MSLKDVIFATQDVQKISWKASSSTDISR